MLGITTCNVNGIRAVARRGGLGWLRDHAGAVICLQEVRATPKIAAPLLAEHGFGDWTWEVSDSRVKPGHSGVALLTSLPVTDVRVGLGLPEYDEQGRWVEMDLRTDLGPVTVASVYVHAGESDGPRLEEKLGFLAAMTDRMAVLQAAEAAGGPHAVVCGDINVAHHEIDIKNHKGNIGKAGFLQVERAAITGWLDSGWTDLGRALGGPGPGPYSWWSWRGKAFDIDSGWRIDYQIATPELAATATDVAVDRAPTYAERWSDHAPVVATYRV